MILNVSERYDVAFEPKLRHDLRKAESICNRPISGPLLHRLLTNPIINGFDLALLFLFLLFLIVEMVADQQQWDFHRRKKVVVTIDEARKASELAKGGTLCTCEDVLDEICLES